MSRLCVRRLEPQEKNQAKLRAPVVTTARSAQPKPSSLSWPFSLQEPLLQPCLGDRGATAAGIPRSSGHALREAPAMAPTLCVLMIASFQCPVFDFRQTVPAARRYAPPGALSLSPAHDLGHAPLKDAGGWKPEAGLKLA